MRVVPRENEAINETWIADRDRFSYEGIYSADRLERPMVRDGIGVGADATGRARSMAAAEGLQAPRRRVAGLAGQRLGDARGAVSAAARWRAAWARSNIDHRLRQRDFRDQAADPLYPGARHADRRGRCARVRCWWSARTCAAKCRCWRIACARPRCRGAQVAFLNPATLRLHVSGGSLPGRRRAIWSAILPPWCAAAAQAAGKRGAGAPGRHRRRRQRRADEHRAIAQRC